MKYSSLYKGSLTTIILKLLNEHNKMYGYQIIQRVEEITHGEFIITEGALYPCLHKLKVKGFINVEVLMIGKRERKYYKLTEKGVTETVKKLAELEDYITVMRALVNPLFRPE